MLLLVLPLCVLLALGVTYHVSGLQAEVEYVAPSQPASLLPAVAPAGPARHGGAPQRAGEVQGAATVVGQAVSGSRSNQRSETAADEGPLELAADRGQQYGHGSGSVRSGDVEGIGGRNAQVEGVPRGKAVGSNEGMGVAGSGAGGGQREEHAHRKGRADRAGALAPRVAAIKEAQAEGGHNAAEVYPQQSSQPEYYMDNVDGAVPTITKTLHKLVTTNMSLEVRTAPLH